MRVLVIIPTYNERENIGIILPAVLAQKMSDELAVLVVDDSSPDGTADAVKEIANRPESSGRISLLSRDVKDGLAGAYLAGFEWGIAHGYELLIEMDADLSHKPEALPEMIETAKKFDYVIGSRYVRGGQVVGWGPLRRFISLGGSLFSRIVLGIGIHDLTGGFNAWNTRIFEKVPLSGVISTGYCFQIELKYRALLAGFTCREMPIVFEDRKYGESKMSKEIFLEAVKNVILLRKRVPRA